MAWNQATRTVDRSMNHLCLSPALDQHGAAGKPEVGRLDAALLAGQVADGQRSLKAGREAPDLRVRPEQVAVRPIDELGTVLAPGEPGDPPCAVQPGGKGSD